MARPGDGLLHPVAVTSLFVLVLNDHVLKAAFHSWWTGKLSDAAILIVLPTFLVAATERIQAIFGRFPAPSRRTLGLSIGLTLLVFVLINTTTWGAETYRVGLGWLQWPFRIGLSWVRGLPSPAVARVFLASDPTDLLTLPFAWVPWWIGVRRMPVDSSRPTSRTYP